MKRWAKVSLALAGVAVAAIVCIHLFVNANTFRPAIERQLATTLGRTVTLGDLRLSIFSGSLIAKDISVSDDPNFSAAPFLTATELRIGVSLRPLIFSRELNLRSFQIEAPQINLIRAANGIWNFSSIGHTAAPGATAAVTSPNSAPPRSGGSAPPDLSVGRIDLEDGHVVITTLPAQGKPSVYDHVNLTAHDFSFASSFPFELSADFAAEGSIHATGHVGPLDRTDTATSPANAQVSVRHLDPVAAGFLDPSAGLSFLGDVDMRATSDGQVLSTTGAVRVQNLKLRKGATAASKPLDLTYTGTHRLKDNTGHIEDATVKIGNTAIHASGTYQPVEHGAEDPLLNLKVVGQNLSIDELQPLMSAAAVRLPNGSVLRGGTLSMNLAVTGQAKALVIAGPLALDNTKLVGFDIGSKIHGIAALGGVKTGDATEFEKLHFHVNVTNAGVVVDQIDGVIPAMGELTGSGTVSPADQLDFNLIVKVSSAKGFGKVGVGLLTKLNGSGSSSGVPMHVSGTPDDPNITADVGKSLAGIFGGKKK